MPTEQVRAKKPITNVLSSSLQSAEVNIEKRYQHFVMVELAKLRSEMDSKIYLLQVEIKQL